MRQDCPVALIKSECTNDNLNDNSLLVNEPRNTKLSVSNASSNEQTVSSTNKSLDDVSVRIMEGSSSTPVSSGINQLKVVSINQSTKIRMTTPLKPSPAPAPAQVTATAAVLPTKSPVNTVQNVKEVTKKSYYSNSSSATVARDTYRFKSPNTISRLTADDIGMNARSDNHLSKWGKNNSISPAPTRVTVQPSVSVVNQPSLSTVGSASAIPLSLSTVGSIYKMLGKSYSSVVSSDGNRNTAPSASNTNTNIYKPISKSVPKERPNSSNNHNAWIDSTASILKSNTMRNASISATMDSNAKSVRFVDINRPDVLQNARPINSSSSINSSNYTNNTNMNTLQVHNNTVINEFHTSHSNNTTMSSSLNNIRSILTRTSNEPPGVIVSTSNTVKPAVSSSNIPANKSTAGGETSTITAINKPVMKANVVLPKFPIGSITRIGIIESMKNSSNNANDPSPLAPVNEIIINDLVIVSNAFKMEDNIKLYVGAPVRGPNGEPGELVGPYAKMGKCKVKFPNGIKEVCLQQTVEILISLPNAV